MFALCEIHVAVGSHIAVGHNVVDEFSVVVDHGIDTELDILVDTKLRLVQVLANIHNFP